MIYKIAKKDNKMSSMGHSTNYIFGEYEILASSDKPVDDNVLDLTYKLVGKGTKYFTLRIRF